MPSVEDSLRQVVAHRKVLVLGLGRQGGVKVANRLAELGAQVRISDQQSAAELSTVLQELHPGIETHLGAHDLADVDWADLIVKNPAVPYDHPMIKEADRQGTPVTSETVLALQCVRQRVIGVTGTRGKTTTAHALWHLLHHTGVPAVLGGNIPQQPTLETVLSAPSDATIVLELSSFQLESLHRAQLSPHIAVLTSLSPDHLNRYGTMDAYVETKAHIFRWQQPGDSAFWISQGEWDQPLRRALPGDVSRTVLTSDDLRIIASQLPLTLPGAHNQANVALAATVVKSLGRSETDIQRAVATFTGVPYRQQVIPTTDGLTWINDTTATTPTALLTALNTYQDQNLILITGGTTKQLPFPDELLQKLSDLQDRIVWLEGSGTQELNQALGHTPQKKYQLISEAVAAARQKAAGFNASTILFSPGFSSFEHFRNEFDRGDQFNAALQDHAPLV